MKVMPWEIKLLNSLTKLLLLLLPLPLYAATLIIEPDQGRKPILDAIKHAKSQVDLAMYGFTDPELMQAFIQAKEQGKSVRVLLQHYPYQHLDENQLAIQRLSSSQVKLGFAPSSYYLLHQKTLLTDQQKALVLSFNFTRLAFKNERNFGLILDEPAEVQEIQKIFNADWENKNESPHSSTLIWSPDNSREKILALMKSAKTELKIYAQGLSDYQLIGALAETAERGVKVQILSSGSQLGKHWDYLKRAGVELRQSKKLLIHAKVIIADRQKAMLGSINFTKPSLDKNRELSVLVSEKDIVGKLIETFDRDWEG